MDKDLNSVTTLEGSIPDSANILLSANNALRKVTVKRLKEEFSGDETVLLNEIAFYFDINEPGTSNVRVPFGGNLNMRDMWINEHVPVIMDENGNYCEVSRSDTRYTTDGVSTIDAAGEVSSDFAHGDFMVIIPQYYVKVQTLTISGYEIQRVWLSLIPLPGGRTVPRQVVGRFKAYSSLQSSSGVMRSLPGVVPTTGTNSWGSVLDMWDIAQNRSKNHGLADITFRTHLMYYIMAYSGFRNVKSAVTSNSTYIWGVGLDGTESCGPGQSASQVGIRQYTIKTGSTLAIGGNGNAEVEDSAGTQVHSTTVAYCENVWGQFFEQIQGAVHVGDTIVVYKGNFYPSVISDNTFDNVEHTTLTDILLSSGSISKLLVVDSGEYQGMHTIARSDQTNVTGHSTSTGGYWSITSGKAVLMFGGRSTVGSTATLNSANMVDDTTFSDSSRTSRLAYYGPINKVSTQRFIELGQ